jgi:hypothetical protein
VNRAPALVPYEPLVVAMALGGVRSTGVVRPLLDTRVMRAPALGPLLRAGGAYRDTAEVMRRLLGRAGWVVAGPETDALFGKTFGDRYRLARFGRAFARVAIETGTPVVPVAVIGSEETHPVLGRLSAAARWLGVPTVPVTPTPRPAADEVAPPHRRADRRRRPLRARGRRAAGVHGAPRGPGARAPPGASSSKAQPPALHLPRIGGHAMRASSPS